MPPECPMRPHPIGLVLLAAFLMFAERPADADPAPCSSEDPRPVDGDVRLRFKASDGGATLECLDGPESQRHLESVETGLAARWKVPRGIEPFPFVVADVRFEASGIVARAEIVEATDPQLGECAKNAFAVLSASSQPVPKCLVGIPIRVRVLIPWAGAPDDPYWGELPRSPEDRLRDLGYVP